MYFVSCGNIAAAPLLLILSNGRSSLSDWNEKHVQIR